MAKMFYTIDEVCSKLGKGEAEVKEMVTSGQIQEFRDRDKLMFKVDQIDLLSGGDEDHGEVNLDLGSSGEGSSLGMSASGLGLSSSASSLELAEDSVLGLSDSREDTGISVFDTGHGESESPSEGTHVGETFEDELSLEAVGSGSGLLDLTRESDDTSLGAELLEEVYSSDDNIEIPANASGLFEASAEPADETAAVGMAASMPMMVEAYDGTGSGLGAGLLVGALAALVCVAIIGITGVLGATPQLALTFAENIWMYVGGLAGVTIVFGLIGMFLGKSSE